MTNTNELYEELRRCSVCNKPLLKGYIFDDGLYYACDDEHRDILSEKVYSTVWEELYSDEGDFYYTDWDEDYTTEELDQINKMIDKELTGN